MNILTRAAIPLVLALAVPLGAATAQTAGTQTHRRPSAETIGRLQDGRIAMAKASLKLSDAQEKLWAPVEDVVRKAYAERASRRAERDARRSGTTDQTSTPLPERLQKASERMSERAATMRALADAVGPLYATFSSEQKAVAGPAIAQLMSRSGRGHARGHRFGMHHGGMTRNG